MALLGKSELPGQYEDGKRVPATMSAIAESIR
jgi:hypothetical protein